MGKSTVLGKKIRVGAIAYTVLQVVAAAGIVTVAVCAPNALQLLKPYLKKKKYEPKQAVYKSIESLIRTGLVRRTHRPDGEPVLELTTRGKWEAYIRGSGVEVRAKKKTWDGKWRIVIFDIPDAKARLRGELRRGMKLFGFHQLQKSVWVYPYSCDDFILVLKTHLELGDSVVYLTTNSIDADTALRKEFDF